MRIKIDSRWPDLTALRNLAGHTLQYVMTQLRALWAT